jgi:hypothetical protein
MQEWKLAGMITASRQAVSHIQFCLQHVACQSIALNISIT